MLVGCGGRSTANLANAVAPSAPAPPDPPPAPSPGLSPSPSPTPSGAPSNATIAASIQGMPGWQWCTAETSDHQPCARGRGNALSSMINDQKTPSLDGSSAKFTIGGSQGYSNALWWEFLTPNPAFTHFVYDFWFYINHPEVSQALEFDVNQTINGTRYTWGSECNFKGTAKWDVWNDKTGQWVPSHVDCPMFSGDVWHHGTWQLDRR